MTAAAFFQFLLSTQLLTVPRHFARETLRVLDTCPSIIKDGDATVMQIIEYRNNSCTTSLPYSWDEGWQNDQLCGSANKKQKNHLTSNDHSVNQVYQCTQVTKILICRRQGDLICSRRLRNNKVKYRLKSGSTTLWQTFCFTYLDSAIRMNNIFTYLVKAKLVKTGSQPYNYIFPCEVSEVSLHCLRY